jgi:hypothetical protein
MSKSRLKIEDPRDALSRPVDLNIALLKKHSLYVRQTKPGEHEIRCPWEDGHSPGGAKYATYFEKDYNGHDMPAFKCQHSNNCGHRHLNDLLDLLIPGRTRSSFQKVDDEDDAQESTPLTKKAAAIAPTLIVTKLSDIKMKDVDWVWHGRVAKKKLAILGGAPGEGKSTLTCYMAGRITRGRRWPVTKEIPEVGSVVVLSSEDDPEDTLKPRMMAAGADPEKVHVIGMLRVVNGKGEVLERGIDLLKDVARLEETIDAIGDVALVIIDPITAYMGVGQVSLNSQSDVRGFLKPISDMSSRCNVAVVAVAHLNKNTSGSSAQNAISGSGAQVAASRSAMIVIPDKDDKGTKIFASAKITNTKPVQSLSYTIETCWVECDGKKVETSRIKWRDAFVEISADDALKELNDSLSGNRRHTRNEAAEWLSGFLAGGRKPLAEVRDAAAKREYSKSTLDRARDEIGVTTERDGFQGGSTWGLPKRKRTDEDVI